jgi:hypothetical protein
VAQGVDPESKLHYCKKKKKRKKTVRGGIGDGDSKQLPTSGTAITNRSQGVSHWKADGSGEDFSPLGSPHLFHLSSSVDKCADF